MSERRAGPAAGTRSRAESGKNATVTTSGKSARKKANDAVGKTTTNLLPNQKSVSDFFEAVIQEPVQELYYSDSEIAGKIGQQRLKRRSKSGTLYPSLIVTEPGAPNQSSATNDCIDTSTNYTPEHLRHLKSTKDPLPSWLANSYLKLPHKSPSVNAITSLNTLNNTPTSKKDLLAFNMSITTRSPLNTVPITSSTITTYSRMNTATTTTSASATNILTSPKRIEENKSEQEPSMYAMLQNINTKLDTISEDVKDLKKDKKSTGEKLQGLQYDIEDTQEQVNQQQRELRACQDQVELLSHIVGNYSEQIQDLKTKIASFEANAKKAEIIIFGLLEQEDIENKDIVINFFSSKLKIPEDKLPQIDFAYRKGKGQARPMVVRLAKVADKGTIFTNVTNLKNQLNPNKKPYRIADHLPEQAAEEKIRQRQIYSKNNKALANKQPMEFKKGKLHINNAPYAKKAKAPDAKQLLTMDYEQIKSIAEVHIADGGMETEQGNKFVAYVATCKNLKTVRDLYLHMKRLHSAASHVTMAYRFAGQNIAYDEDFFDDGEHGAGRRLLEKLVSEEKTDIVVFIIRYYSGQHIGSKRYDIHEKLLKAALSAHSKDNLRVSKLGLRQLQASPKIRRPRQRAIRAQMPAQTAAKIPPPSIRSPVPLMFQPRFSSKTFNRFTSLPSQSSGDERWAEIGSTQSTQESDSEAKTLLPAVHSS